MIAASCSTDHSVLSAKGAVTTAFCPPYQSVLSARSVLSAGRALDTAFCLHNQSVLPARSVQSAGGAFKMAFCSSRHYDLPADIMTSLQRRTCCFNCTYVQQSVAYVIMTMFKSQGDVIVSAYCHDSRLVSLMQLYIKWLTL